MASVALARLRYEVRCRLGRHPAIFLPLIRLKRSKAALAVRGDTEIVIEGYPRSGNTFAAAAFTLAQRRPVAVARHLHVPAQVIWAVRRRLPVLVLVRDPIDAVVSLVIREESIGWRQAFREYERFYRTIFPHHQGFVVGTFQDVVTDLGEVIRRVNRRFGTGFAAFEHDENNLKRVFELIDRMDRLDTGKPQVGARTVARPSDEREQAKARLKSEVLGRRGLRSSLEAAREVHRMYERLGRSA